MVATTEPATTNDGIKLLKRKSQTKTFNPGPRQNRRGEAPSTAPALPGNESLALSGSAKPSRALSGRIWLMKPGGEPSRVAGIEEAKRTPAETPERQTLNAER
jgi:hypothetical protein